jgi:hypothetical protein
MRGNRWLVAAAAIGLLAAGCWYQQPNLERRFSEASVGMNKEELAKTLGQPSVVLGNEVLYNYDDPEKPARFRFVFNDQGIIVEKYFEPKLDLARKAAEQRAALPPVERMPEEPGRVYPGGPLPRFETKPGMPERVK